MFNLEASFDTDQIILYVLRLRLRNKIIKIKCDQTTYTSLELLKCQIR